jgi:hypothetical protein
VNYILGLASIAMGLLAIGVGGRAAMTAQRPSWLTARSIPSGRERPWGVAVAMLGFGIAALGGFWLSESDFGALGILGVGLLFVGVGFLVVAVRPDSIRR